MGKTNKTPSITAALSGACVGILILFAAGAEANAQATCPVDATGNVEAEFLLTDMQRAGLDRLFAGPLLNREPRDISGDLRNLILGARSGSSVPPSASSTLKFDLNGTLLVMRDTERNIQAVRGFLERYGGFAGANASTEGTVAEQKDFRKEESPESGLEARPLALASAEDRLSRTPDAEIRREKQVESASRVLGSALHGASGPEEAAASGRVLIPDPVSGTIHVVDTPGNLDKTREYLSGSTPRSSGSHRVYRSQHRTARDLGNAMQGLVMYSYQ
jgi:hypothetical protein